MKINRRIIELSILSYFMLLLPISYVHESGHAAVCSASAHKAEIHFTFGGLYTTCTPDLFTQSFYITGPAYGLAVSIGILFAGIYLAKPVLFLPRPEMKKSVSDKGDQIVRFTLPDSYNGLKSKSSVIFFGLVLIVVGIAQSTDQAVKVVLEGFYTSIYESNDAGMNGLVTAIQLTSLIVPIVIMSKLVQRNQFLAEGGVMLDAIILAWVRNPLSAIDMIRREIQLRRVE